MMTTASFSLSSIILGEVGVDPQQIRGIGGPDFPRLSLTLEVMMRPHALTVSEGRSQPGLMVRHTLIQILGVMSFQGRRGNEIEIAEFASKPLLHLSKDSPSTYQISIPLDLAKVNRIEEHRAGDAVLKFQCTALLAKHPALVKGGGVNDADESIEALRSANFTFQVHIPQSHWINYVLPGLGYGKIRIVEIPTPDKVIPEVFAQAIKEFEKAQQYLKQSDFDKAVAHCRNTLDLIPKVVKLKFEANARPSYPDRVRKLLKEHLPVPLADSKREAIEKMLTTLWNLTSISHHQNSQDSGYFSRADADLIMLTTTALLSYVGRLLSAE
ncbi:MAG: hypothetical protein KF868_13955 [Acidobacteria bacterium]|nr:hypothetical protein [Acidobacteriota bacterium]